MISRQSQCSRILAVLKSGGWIPLTCILDMRIASYTRRIHELRKMGYEIETHTEWVNGVRHSKYRLLPEGGGNGKE